MSAVSGALLNGSVWSLCVCCMCFACVCVECLVCMCIYMCACVCVYMHVHMCVWLSAGCVCVPLICTENENQN